MSVQGRAPMAFRFERISAQRAAGPSLSAHRRAVTGQRQHLLPGCPEANPLRLSPHTLLQPAGSIETSRPLVGALARTFLREVAVTVEGAALADVRRKVPNCRPGIQQGAFFLARRLLGFVFAALLALLFDDLLRFEQEQVSLLLVADRQAPGPPLGDDGFLERH